MATKSTRLPGTEFESTGNRARAAAGGGPNVGGFKNTVATDIGAGAAVALELVQRANAERDAVASVKAETGAVTSAEKAMAELDPMAPDYQDKVKQIWGDATKSALETSGITTTAAKDDLERRMTRHTAGAELIGTKLRKDAVSKEAFLSAKDAMNATSAKIRNDPGNANAYLAEHQADMERLKVGMDPNTLRAFSRQAADEFAKNQVIGYAEKGNFRGAREALKAQAAHLDTGVVTSLSSYVDSKESKARVDGDRAQLVMANNLQARMYDWAHGMGPPVSREEIDNKFKNTPQYATMVNTFGAITERVKAKGEAEVEKVIAQKATDISARISDAQAGKGEMPSREEIDALKTFRQYDELVKQHNSTEIAQRKIELKTEAAVEASRTGTLKNQEQADLAISATLGNVPIGRIAIEGNPQQRAIAIQAMAGVASTNGFLYGPFKDLLENSDKTTDKSRAGQVAFAAEAADDLENTAPRALDGAKLDSTGTLAIVRSEAKRLIEQGVPKQQAYKQAADTHMAKGPLTLQEETDRKAVIQKELQKIDLKGKVDTAITSFAERNLPFVKMPGQDAAMQGEWKRSYEAAYMRTGSAEQAETIANKSLQSMFGVTQVGAVGKKAPPVDGPPEAAALNPLGFDPAGSKPQMVRRPIEKYLPPSMRALAPEEQALVIQNQIEPGLKAAGITLVKDPTFPALAAYRLTADNRTEQDLRDGRAPTYRVQVLRKGSDGQYEDVPGLPRFNTPTEADVVKDTTYQDINAQRIQRDLKARQDYLTNQTEIRTRKERTAPGERPSQMPQSPKFEPLVKKGDRVVEPTRRDNTGESAIRNRQKEYLEGKK